MPRKSKKKLKQAQAAYARHIYQQQKSASAQELRQDPDYSEWQEINYKIKSQETVLITDRKLEKYLDSNYVCDCLHDKLYHTVKISDQHDKCTVTKNCSHCKLTVTQTLTENHEHDDVVGTSSGLKRRKDTESSATKRLKLFRQDTEENSEEVTARETVLMVTDKELEKYLDNNYVKLCHYCSHNTLRHIVRVDDHDVQVMESCSICNHTVLRELMGNYEILKTLVYFNMLNGQGYMFYKSMCAINGMEFVSPLVYRRCENHTRNVINMRWQEVQENTRRIIFDQYKKQLNIDPIDGFLNIDVSFSGSRSPYSQISTAFLVEMLTGMVVDFNVFCKKTCIQCQMLKRRKRNSEINEAQFDDEMDKHLPHCDKNYYSRPKNMEEDAALLMWGRSQNIKLRYTTLVDNSNSSSTYNKVCGMNYGAGPYGDVKVEKTECENYLVERLVTQIIHLESKGEAEGNGKLSYETFGKLMVHFKRAIRDNINTDWRKMRKACLSGLFHETSTDENPLHHFCPEGKNSWCFYQHDLANKKIQRTHKTMNIPQSNEDEFEIQKIYFKFYDDLISEENMKKCLKGKPNESLHNRVWNSVPKDRSVSRSMVEFSMAVTAINHNAESLGSLTGIPQHDITILMMMSP